MPDTPSPATPDYNCIAWAAGDDQLRWDFVPGYYWPHRIPRNGNLDTVVRVFRSLGFEICDDGDAEPEIEKIALYAVGNEFRHAAWQTMDGNWTSKIGTLEDIKHDTTDSLTGDEYGQVAQYMKRQKYSIA